MESCESTDTWFLAQLKPNCANIANRNLKRQGFKTFLPMEQVTRRRSGSFKATEQPLFPGYMFVGFDVEHGLWRKVNSTYGVTRLVSFGGEPQPVPTGLVAQLESRCDPSGNILPEDTMGPGDQVTLTNGPFAGLVAEVEKIAPQRRVWMLIEIMGGQTRLSAEVDQLRVL